MSFIGSLFSPKQSAPPPPPPPPQAPPPPTRDDAAKAAQEEAAKIRRGQGAGSTILTSGQGLLDPVTSPKKTLLGQ